MREPWADVEEKLLDELARGKAVGIACDLAGTTSKTAYARASSDPAFAARFRAAQRRGKKRKMRRR